MAIAAGLLILLLFGVIIALTTVTVGGAAIPSMSLIALAIIGFAFILFGPAVMKLYDLVFNTSFEFGSPLLISAVVVVILIFMFRRR